MKIAHILSGNFENNNKYYLLQVVPLHWSLNLTSQETIWAEKIKKYQNNLDNVKAALVHHVQSKVKLLPF